VNIQLQTAINHVDAQYAVPTGMRANFVRAKEVSITGGPGVTVQILG
jgi:hypothetical protein